MLDTAFCPALSLSVSLAPSHCCCLTLAVSVSHSVFLARDVSVSIAVSDRPSLSTFRSNQVRVFDCFGMPVQRFLSILLISYKLPL